MENEGIRNVDENTKELLVYSVDEIIALHDKCMKKESTVEERENLLKLFDKTKNQIALITVEERIVHANNIEKLKGQRVTILSYIEAYWTKYFEELVKQS